MNNVISKLKKARKELAISQAELGERVGLPQSHISKIESGKSDIQLSSLVQIARALDLELQLVPKKAIPAVQSIVRSTMQRSPFPKTCLNNSENLNYENEDNKNLQLLNLPSSPAYSLDNDDE